MKDGEQDSISMKDLFKLFGMTDDDYEQYYGDKK